MYTDVHVKHFGIWPPLGINAGIVVLNERSINKTFLRHKKSAIIFHNLSNEIVYPPKRK